MRFHGVPPGITAPPRQRAGAAAPEHHVGGQTPGTFVLVIVFLLAFVVYYFVNWKLLSFVWRVG